jgi:hypothetical protein
MVCSYPLDIPGLGILHRIRTFFPFQNLPLQLLTSERTLFQTPNTWPMDDKADPLNGWSITDVHKVSSRAAFDLYGKLFAYLHTEFTKFLDHLVTVKVDFQLYCLDVRSLTPLLEQNTYNRIEVCPLIKEPTAYYTVPSPN